MYRNSTLSHSDAGSAVGLFEQGFTAKSVALSLGLARNPVQMLYQRGQLRGGGALVTGVRKQYDLKTKRESGGGHVNGESGRVLAGEYDPPAPATVPNWAVVYRRDGED